MERDEKHFPNQLRRYRMLLGYKQVDVAKLLGYKTSQIISRWENGICLPSVENLFRLSIIYRTFANELYFDLTQQLKKELEVEFPFACINPKGDSFSNDPNCIVRRSL